MHSGALCKLRTLFEWSQRLFKTGKLEKNVYPSLKFLILNNPSLLTPLMSPNSDVKPQIHRTVWILNIKMYHGQMVPCVIYITCWQHCIHIKAKLILKLKSLNQLNGIEWKWKSSVAFENQNWIYLGNQWCYLCSCSSLIFKQTYSVCVTWWVMLPSCIEGKRMPGVHHNHHNV